jgi:hypothetical protein
MRQLEQVIDPAVAQLGQAAGAGQLLVRVLADGFQHAEAHFAAGQLVALEETLVDQRLQAVQHRRAGANLVQRFAHDGRRGFDGTAASEDRQLAEERPLVIREQVIAVADGLAERALAHRQVASTVDEHLEPIAQAGQQRLGRQHARASRRELDRQRQAIQAHAHLADGGGVLLGQLEARLGGSGALDEQLDGGRFGHAGDVGIRVTRREGQREDREDVLPAQTQRRPAGGQDLQVRADGQQVGHLIGRGQDVFEVVEDEQDVAVEQDTFKPLQQRLVAPFSDTQRLGDGGADQRRVVQPREVDEEHTVGEELDQRLGQRQRQAGLARAGRAGEGHQPHVIAQQHLAGELQLTRSTDDLGRLRA